MRIVLLGLIAACATACLAWGQDGGSTDDIQQGRRLAIRVCANCHLVAPDQPFKPILQPPAPSFESIAQRPNVSAASISAFLTTTHRGLDNPKGMPTPELLDYQIKRVTAYLLSLRKRP
jgi:mono/diheme cytochrome c family protein